MSNLNEFISTDRQEFTGDFIDENKLPSDPLEYFNKWLSTAVEKEVNEPYAMILGTSSDGIPSCRIVYLRGINEGKLRFYSNYKSEKGRQIYANHNVCLNFFWPELSRQVRISGVAVKCSEEDSDAYFNSRPRMSQIGAWASEQSRILPNRSALENRVEQFVKKFEDQEVTRPVHWGGYDVTPEIFEFWQGQPSRLHDRILFEKRKDDGWSIKRLSP